MGRLIDADKLSADMYHEAFEKDSDMQKWDSGCWIRYKMFENVLKAQPTAEPETISKWKKEFREYVGSLDIARDDWKGIIEYIEELPSIQSERKTGRWIPDNTDYYRSKFICSVCGESEEVPTTGFGYGTMWDYCPMCGAKMEGGADMRGDKHETD